MQQAYTFYAVRYLSVNSPELFFGLFRVRVGVRIRVNSVTETNIMTEK